MAEEKIQRSEDRKQRSEDRKQKTEVRRRMLETIVVLMRHPSFFLIRPVVFYSAAGLTPGI